MKKTMAFLFSSLVAVCLLPSLASAGSFGYAGLGSEKVYLQDAADVKNVTYVKFEGVNSPWAGKTIKTKKTTTSSGARYSFDYVLELSSGKHDRTYTLVADSGKTLVSGTLTPQIQLFFQGGDARNPLKLSYDKALSESALKMDLAAEYKKTPYVPDVD